MDHRYIIHPGEDIQTINAYWALRHLMEGSLKSVGWSEEEGDFLTARYKGYMVRFQRKEDQYSVRFSNYALPALRKELRELVGYRRDE